MKSDVFPIGNTRIFPFSSHLRKKHSSVYYHSNGKSTTVRIRCISCYSSRTFHCHGANFPEACWHWAWWLSAYQHRYGSLDGLVSWKILVKWATWVPPILEAEKGKIPENFRKDSGEILWFGQNFVDFGIVMEMTVYFGCGPPLRIQLLPPRWFWVWKSQPKPSFATGMLGGRLPGWSQVNPKYINFRDPW